MLSAPGRCVDATIVMGGPEALSWRDVVAIYEEVTGRAIDVRTVAPGQPLPGLPDVVAQLAAGLDTYDSPLPMDDACATYGVELTSAREFAARARVAATAVSSASSATSPTTCALPRSNG